jgi:hypothetical protein
MCPEFGILATIAVFVFALWYSFVVLKNGAQDIISGWKYKDRLGVVKGGLKIVLLPVVFLGIGVAGLLLIEFMYACG